MRNVTGRGEMRERKDSIKGVATYRSWHFSNMHTVSIYRGPPLKGLRKAARPPANQYEISNKKSLILARCSSNCYATIIRTSLFRSWKPSERNAFIDNQIMHCACIIGINCVRRFL